jgi:hypothetical protein
MATFFVSYDLRAPGQDYKPLWARLTLLRGKRVLESVWAVPWAGTASQLFATLGPLLDANDRLIVINAADAGWSDTVLADPSKVA